MSPIVGPPFIGCVSDTDIILCHILEFDDARVAKEAIASRWRHAASRHFRKKAFRAPAIGELTSMDMELDTPSSKRIFSAELKATAGAYGLPELKGRVNFLDWKPSFLRPRKHQNEEVTSYYMSDADAAAAWMSLVKMQEKSSAEAVNRGGPQGPGGVPEGQLPENFPLPPPEGAGQRGVLRLHGSCADVLAHAGPWGQRLEAYEIQHLLELLDASRNPRLIREQRHHVAAVSV
jgi:hypothetical protein